VNVYIAHYQKISNALSTSRQYFAQRESEEVNRKSPAIATQRYNFQPFAPTLQSATMHSVTDRQTTVLCQEPIICVQQYDT